MAISLCVLYYGLDGGRKTPKNFQLYNFEKDADLNRLFWNCKTLYMLFDGFHSNGARSLRIEMYPSLYPGVSFKLEDKNWGFYSTLALEIDNPQTEVIEMTVRIDDSESADSYEDRFNKLLVLKPGINRIRLSLTSLVTSGTHRPMNLGNISKFMIFVVNPQKRLVVYMDNIRLES